LSDKASKPQQRIRVFNQFTAPPPTPVFYAVHIRYGSEGKPRFFSGTLGLTGKLGSMVL